MNEGGGGRKKSSPETLMNTIFDVDNKTIRNLLQRRTIREFKDEPLDDALLARLFEMCIRDSVMIPRSKNSSILPRSSLSSL